MTMTVHDAHSLPVAHFKASLREHAAAAEEPGRQNAFACPRCHRREIARVSDDIWQCQHEDCNFMWQSH